MEHTKKLAQFIADTRYADVPARALAAAKDAILDSVGVTLAGSQDEAATIARQLVRDEYACSPGAEGTGAAAVFAGGFRSASAGAALANGVAGHALDFDFSFAVGGQPMAGLTAATFSVAEPLHATGARLLEAWIVGFETAGKVLRCMPAHTEAGWHSTGTIGSFGATAAACRLLGLDADRVSMALGIAASMASGLSTNFGTMSKPLHAGLAARNGVMAARLAQRGYTANPLLLEGPRGFFETFAEGEYDVDALDTAGQGFEIEAGVRYKAYPCGGLTHTAIDAVLAIRDEEGVTADEIERIDCGVTAGVAKNIRYRIPETPLQGKFSIPYILARAALHGAVTIDHFTEDAIREPAAVAMAERITMTVDPELKDTGTVSRPSRVRVHLKNGRSFFREVDAAKGSPVVPLTEQELRAKFTGCATHALSADASAKALDMIVHLETLKDVGDLTAILIGA